MERARQVLTEHISTGTTPGAVAVVVRGGDTVATLMEGRHTYDTDARPVAMSDRYDLASLTKPVTATACMLLEEQSMLSTTDLVSAWVPAFVGGGREAVQVQHLLAHCSGLPAHLPLYEWCSGSGEFAEAICDISLETPPGEVTRYSDLGFILLGAVLEAASGSTLESLLTERVLNPMGMHRTGFCPSTGLLGEIPPTEVGELGLIHGAVHDENAQAMGGVASHAGLFGPATDLARLLTAYQNGGRLDGAQVLPEEGARRYVTRAGIVDGSTRGLGWDTVSEEGSSAGRHFSTRSFGHLGFTGTSMWADPETGLGVVLLTNRVHPTRKNNAIRELRPAFHDAVSEALGIGARAEPSGR